ncbi:MAG TPA: DUF2293 domain-containing protein [Rhizobiaceae bacterium]|nr:DUF2293 domain-containing protein [Rhizobiaceae bacterium]
MQMLSKRQRAIARALNLYAPHMPFADAEPVKRAAEAPHMKALPPQIATWLALVAHVRHTCTEYDALLDEGYDRDSARHFVIDAINAQLERWGSTRFVDEEDEA